MSKKPEYQHEVEVKPCKSKDNFFAEAHGVYVSDKLAFLIGYRAECGKDGCICKGWYLCDPTKERHLVSHLGSMEVCAAIAQAILSVTHPRVIDKFIKDTLPEREGIEFIAGLLAVSTHILLGVEIGGIAAFER